MNITFPALPCSVISLDTLDLSGNHAPEKDRKITKTRLDAQGHGLPPSPPSEHDGGRRIPAHSRRLLFDNHHNHGGAAAAAGAGGSKPTAGGKPDLRQFGNGNILLSKLLSELLPSVFDDKEAVAELRQHIGEGCHMEGSMIVNKVAGNFHFSLSKADLHVLMSVYGKRDSINVSHVIHRCVQQQQQQQQYCVCSSSSIVCAAAAALCVQQHCVCSSSPVVCVLHEANLLFLLSRLYKTHLCNFCPWPQG